MATEQPRAVWCCSTCGAIYHKDYPRCPADGAEVVIADRDPLLGSVIGHYTIDKLIGEGGMGRVYFAHHAHLPNKRYAIKVLLGDHGASAAMRARFTREAERASQLDHPNVVKVVDFGQTDHGLLYIVMDYVDGPSLVSQIGDQPMAPARVIALAREICKGLRYAHAAGIVHRDLKPENILVSSSDTGPVPRIVDFGLALSVDQSDARLTESGMTMGTPAFAAPEQLAGKPIDHRADLYALGMTMFEMLTGGKPPLDGHVFEVMSARTARDIPRITERLPGLELPRELEDVVARLTRRRPTERFADAQEVIDALDRIRIGPQARLATDRLANQRRSRRRWLIGAALSACVGGGLAWYAATADAGGGDASAAAIAEPGSPDPAEGPADRAAAIAAAAKDRAAAPAAPSDRPAGSAVVAVGPAAGGGAAPAGRPVAGAAAATSDPDADRTAASTPARLRHRPRAGRAAASASSGASAGTSSGASSGAPSSAPGRAASPRAASPAVAAAAAPPGSPSSAAAVEVRRPAAALIEPAVATAPPPSAVLPPRRELRAVLNGIEVSGSLPPGDVQRAVERRTGALAGCVATEPDAVIARFTIGETRRAHGIRATGAAAKTNACVANALGDVRTEAAPDVGDVEVTVRIAFVVKT